MTTELAKPTGDTIRAKIVERIRASFVDLIPDTEWDALVASEIRAFTVQGDDCYSAKKPAPLRGILREELDKLFREKVIATLNSPKYLDSWDESGLCVSAFVEKYIADNLPLIIKAGFGSSIQGAISLLRSSIQEMMRKPGQY